MSSSVSLSDMDVSKCVQHVVLLVVRHSLFLLFTLFLFLVTLSPPHPSLPSFFSTQTFFFHMIRKHPTLMHSRMHACHYLHTHRVLLYLWGLQSLVLYSQLSIAFLIHLMTLGPHKYSKTSADTKSHMSWSFFTSPITLKSV